MSAITTSKKITVTLPSINMRKLLKKIYRALGTHLSSFYNPNRVNTGEAAARLRIVGNPFSKIPKIKFDKNSLRIILPAVFGVVLLLGIIGVIRSLPDAKVTPTQGTQIDSPDSLATVNLDKKFNFPLRDESGKVAGTYEYVIQSANLQKQIIVQGQRATAVKDRVFLILNLKITNSLEQTLQLNTRDYLRIAVASNPKELLAPDIHNDPVEVQAISTKYTRVGIAIDEEDAKKLISLKVGEIGGEKQNIDIKFDY